MALRNANKSIVREVAAAFERAEGEALRRYWRPDAVYHVPGNTPSSGTHVGHGAIQALAEWRRKFLSGKPYHVEVYRTSASERHVVLLARVRAERGCAYEWQATWLYFFERGLITDCWLLVDDAQAFGAFWGADTADTDAGPGTPHA